MTTQAHTPTGGPPRPLVQGLLDGPSLLTGFEWHERIGSTNSRCLELAAEGHPEGYVVAADVQTEGRGRLGRSWTAPAGTSLMCSVLLRPPVRADARLLLPLLVGVALADTVAPRLGSGEVTLKWPNDLLIGGRKAAGILVESAGTAAVVGIGLNTDWRGVARPDDLATATSLAEATGQPVDRWRVFAALVGVLGNRYASWCANPRAFLPDYRARCATVGQTVRVTTGAGELEGRAVAIADSGALAVHDAEGAAHEIAAGDVTHVRRVS